MPLYTGLFDQNTSLNTQRSQANSIKTGYDNLTPTSPDENNLLQTSTNIFIYANNSIVGMIQSFTINESRTINKLQSIGWEGVVQAVPSNTNGGSLNVSRIALYESNIWNALGLTTTGNPNNPLGAKVFDSTNSADPNQWDTSTHYTGTTGNAVSSRLIFKTLKDQRVPLEIQVRTRKNGNGNTSQDYYIETYVDCWLSSYSKSYTVQNITIAEQATVQYADVY